MSISVQTVRHIASLARLQFSEEDESRLAGEMSRILDFMAKLNELDTTGVPPMQHVLDLYNVDRPDVVKERISREEALRPAPDADEAFFRVPKVIS